MLCLCIGPLERTVEHSGDEWMLSKWAVNRLFSSGLRVSSFGLWLRGSCRPVLAHCDMNGFNSCDRPLGDGNLDMRKSWDSVLICVFRGRGYVQVHGVRAKVLKLLTRLSLSISLFKFWVSIFLLQDDVQYKQMMDTRFFRFCQGILQIDRLEW